jgi:uncharacterized protein (TIGR02757 family)
LYETYDFEARLRHDPIKVPKRYGQKEDAEAAGFIAASLAYGRVSLFLPVIDRVLGRMGSSPHAFLREFDAGKHAGLFSGISYRFSSAEDIAALLYVMGVLLKKYGSIEAAFLRHYSPRDPDTGAALSGLVEETMRIDTTPVYGSNIRPAGFGFFFPSPRGGSACKRLSLFLRWMARRADIDLGLWRGLPPGRLVIPLDTHIARVSRCLGFTGRKSNGWKTAVEITGALKALDPADPLKYDFALCHRGISGVCAEEGCGECELGAYRNTSPL